MEATELLDERLRIVVLRIDNLLDDGAKEVTLTRREINVILDQLDARTKRVRELEDEDKKRRSNINDG